MATLCILGSRGMFGRDALGVFSGMGFEVVGADLPEVDICSGDSLGRLLDERSPRIVINAAAYTDVDGAESHRNEAFRINAEGARRVAEACSSRGIFLVYISTDYVFPGNKSEGYLPGDKPAPAVNAYGESKLEGERATLETMEAERCLICRTQWLYGGHGKNFVDAIRALAAERDELRVVNDQWGVPTYTENLALQIGALVGLGVSGITHTVGGGGPITWYRFASEIVRLSGASATVAPCASSAFPRPAPRPRYGWLRTERVPSGVITDWRSDLAAYLAHGPKN